MAFLQVVTRTFNRRPNRLARNQASLAALTDADWEQTLVVDEEGRGCVWANQNLATVPATGAYLWVLDDDDECAMPDLVGRLKADTMSLQPAVVMARASHAVFGILPHDGQWGRRPKLGDCGYSNFFIRGDIWESHRPKLGDFACYAADFALADYLWEQGVPFVFWNHVVAHYPQRSIGAGE